MTLATASIAARLAEISGAGNTTGDPAQLSAYQIAGIVPAAAVRPGSHVEISEIVKFAAAEKLAVIPCGARTKLAVGAVPNRYDLAVDVTRLDHVVAYDPSDLTLSVEPGIPLQRLAGVLAGHRQFLPLAVPFLSRATAGGTIAAGAPSALRQAYGTARDFLLGVEFATGQGAATKSGGLVVKNVAGYDLHKLMIGALGTLGIITKLNFRTFPSFASTRVLAACSETPQGVLDLRRRVAQSPLRPLTVDILNPGAVEMLASERAARVESRPEAVDQLPNSKWAFLVTYSGARAVLERYERDLRQMAKESACEDIRNFGDEQSPGTFGRLREFIPIALEMSPLATIVKLSVLPTRMNNVLNAVAQATETNKLTSAIVASGLGEIHAALLPRAAAEEAKACVASATEKILSFCTELGGNATIRWCPAEWKNELKIWGLERPDFEQMRSLKKIFDPAAVFAPGRFAGGI